MKNLLFFLSTLLLNFCLNAQISNYTTGNSGLLGNNVTSIGFDSQGNTWFLTYEQGVSKFDGTNWTTYTHNNSGLINEFVHVLGVDSMDQVWIGTFNGLSVYDGSNWSNYTTANGLVSDNILSIAFDNQNNKWIGATGGVSMFDGTTWHNHTLYDGLIDSSVTAIAFDSQGNKWFGSETGITKYDGVNYHYFLQGEPVLDIAIDSFDNIWCAIGLWQGPNLGVKKYDGITWTSITQANSGLAHNNVRSISVDKDNKIWFATQAGVSVFDGTDWLTYTASNTGMVSSNINVVAFDAQNNKWIGSSGGVSMMTYKGIPLPINICYVECDSLTQKNKITWLNNLPQDVDSVGVYYEASVNVWQKIGTAPATQNYFIDANSNPNSQSYSYAITAINAQNVESVLSPPHTSITLLSAYTPLTNTYGFTWSAYEGISVSNYNLYGVGTDGSLTLIGSVPGNQFFFNYTNPDTAFISFFVGFLAPACGVKTDYLVKSNKVSSSANTVDLQNADRLIKIFPNPADDVLFIDAAKFDDSTIQIIVSDLKGAIVFSKTLYATENRIDVSDLPQGFYFINVNTKDVHLTQKMMIMR